MARKIHRPAYIKDAHIEFLDNLKSTEETIRLGASRMLLRQFGFAITPEHAAETAHYWIESYDERNGK